MRGSSFVNRSRRLLTRRCVQKRYYKPTQEQLGRVYMTRPKSDQPDDNTLHTRDGLELPYWVDDWQLSKDNDKRHKDNSRKKMEGTKKAMLPAGPAVRPLQGAMLTYTSTKQQKAQLLSGTSMLKPSPANGLASTASALIRSMRRPTQKTAPVREIAAPAPAPVYETIAALAPVPDPDPVSDPVPIPVAAAAASIPKPRPLKRPAVALVDSAPAPAPVPKTATRVPVPVAAAAQVAAVAAAAPELPSSEPMHPIARLGHGFLYERYDAVKDFAPEAILAEFVGFIDQPALAAELRRCRYGFLGDHDPQPGCNVEALVTAFATYLAEKIRK